MPPVIGPNQFYTPMNPYQAMILAAAQRQRQQLQNKPYPVQQQRMPGGGIMGGLLGGMTANPATTGEAATTALDTWQLGEALPEFGAEYSAPDAYAGILGSGTETATPFMGVGALPALGIAAGVGLGAKGAYDMFKGKPTKGIGDWAARGTLGVATGGLSEVARAAGLFGRKGTKDYRKERWGNLASNTPSESAKQYFNAQLDDKEDDGIWDEGKYKGKKWKYDLLRDAVINPTAKEASARDHYLDSTGLIGAVGNFETFGDKWFGTPEDKQIEITKRLAQENLYSPDMGSIVISGKKGHQDRARQIYDEIMGQGGAPINPPPGLFYK